MNLYRQPRPDGEDHDGSSSDDQDNEFQVNIPFTRTRLNHFDYINATDDLELTIIPHQIII